MNPERVAELIRAGLPGADVLVRSDDNTHFAARVIAREFAGKRGIARHQLVYRALGELGHGNRFDGRKRRVDRFIAAGVRHHGRHLRRQA